MRALVHLHWKYTPSIIQMQQEFNQNFIEIIEWFPEKELKAEGVYVLLGWDWESFCQTESELLLLSLFGRTSRYWHTLWKYDPNAVLIKITAKWAGILTDIAIVIHYNVFNIQKIKQHTFLSYTDTREFVLIARRQLGFFRNSLFFFFSSKFPSRMKTILSAKTRIFFRGDILKNVKVSQM